MAETQQTLFEKCCACLDDGGVKYSVDRIEDSDISNFNAAGDDLQMYSTIRVICGGGCPHPPYITLRCGG